MRVALLTQASVWGGTEVHTLHLAHTLAERGHDVAIVELGRGLFGEHLPMGRQGLRVVRVDLPAPVEQVGVRAWLKVLRPLQVDAGVLVKGWYLGTSLWLELAARLCFRRYLVIEHHPADPPPRYAVRWHLRGLLPGIGLWWYAQHISTIVRRRLPRRIIAVSDAVRNALIRDHGYPSERIVRVHNGVDPHEFRPDTCHRAAKRAVWDIPPDAIVFGAVGRLHSIKRFDVAVDLFARLAADNPGEPIWLVLAGTGPESEALQRQAAAAGLEARVVFPGWVEHSRDVLSVLDVFLMPSTQEGLGIALLEAMACGCCSIATNVGGVPEVLSGAELGWLVPADDRESFFRAMQAALDMSAEERHAMGERARKHVLRDFHAAKQFARIAELIENV